MDPTVALNNCRAHAATIMARVDLDPAYERSGDTNHIELAESFQALDEWIAKGGFLPEQWLPGQPQ